MRHENPAEVSAHAVAMLVKITVAVVLAAWSRSYLLGTGLAVVLLCTHRGLGAWRLGDLDGARDAALGSIAACLPLACLAWFDQSGTPVTGFRYFTCGGPLPLFPFVTLAVFGVGRVVVRRVVAPWWSAASPGALARGAVVLGSLLAGIVTHGATRAHVHTRDRWIEAQPYAGTARIPEANRDRLRHRVEVGGVCLERRCAATAHSWLDCELYAARNCRSLDSMRREGSFTIVGDAKVLNVRRGRDVVLVESCDARGPDGCGRPWAFVGPSMRPAELSVGDLRAQLIAPRGWIVGGLIGAVLALALGALGLTTSRGVTGTWREAWHAGEGRVVLGGITTTLPVTVSVPVGPIWLRGEARHGDGYRELGSYRVREVCARSPEALAARARWLTAFGLSSALCLASPMLVAAVLGLM